MTAAPHPRDILREIEGPPGKSGTHQHVIGSSGLGKSKYLEWLMREALLSNRGFCFIDWHGTTYQALVEYLAYMPTLDREVVLLNPSNPTHITGFNPFIDPGEDPSTTVGRRIDLTVKSWGGQNTNQTPTLERVCRILYHFAIAAGETLPNAALLLDWNHQAVAHFAERILDTPDHFIAHRRIRDLLDAKTPAQWRDHVGSTDNRITRLIGPKGLRRYIGLKSGNVNIAELMDRNAVILVNLARSGNLDSDPAKVFAAFLINEFYSAAIRRAGTKKHYHLILDEFQEYVTFDVADMLVAVRKGGLHLTLAHQNLAQLEDQKQLLEAVIGNCLVKTIFGGLSYESAAYMAQEVYLPAINTEHATHIYTGQRTTGYKLREQPTVSHAKTKARALNRGASLGEGSSSGVSASEHTETENESESGTLTENYSRSDSDSQTVQSGTAYFLEPIHEEIETGRMILSREEKVSRYAERLKHQPERHCTMAIRNQTGTTIIPMLKRFPRYPAEIAEYETKQYARQGALPAAEVDLILVQSERDFLARIAAESLSREKPKKEKKPKPAQAGPHDASPWPEGAETPLTSKTKPTI